MPQSGIIKPKLQLLTLGTIPEYEFFEHAEAGSCIKFTCPACHTTVNWAVSAWWTPRCNCGTWDINISFEMTEK